MTCPVCFKTGPAPRIALMSASSRASKWQHALTASWWKLKGWWCSWKLWKKLPSTFWDEFLPKTSWYKRDLGRILIAKLIFFKVPLFHWKNSEIDIRPSLEAISLSGKYRIPAAIIPGWRIHGIGLFTYIKVHKHQPYVGKYSMLGSYGIQVKGPTFVSPCF